MKWQMDQESILKEINDPRKILTIGRVLSFRDVMKSKKKTKSTKKINRLEQKKNKNLKDDTTNSTKISLTLYRYDENGEPI